MNGYTLSLDGVTCMGLTRRDLEQAGAKFLREGAESADFRFSTDDLMALMVTLDEFTKPYGGFYIFPQTKRARP